jgi:hypothetical protein
LTRYLKFLLAQYRQDVVRVQRAIHQRLAGWSCAFRLEFLSLKKVAQGLKPSGAGALRPD